MKVLGAVIAGGKSTRYGSPKALAEIDGERVVDRVVRALRAVVDEVVVIANDEALANTIGLSWRSDRAPDLGPLGGFDAALSWAVERECSGVLAVACDMPFLSSSLLSLLLSRAASSGADAVVPESAGPRGIEPLTAYYSTSCLPAIEAALARGDNRLIAFHNDVRVERVALADVAVCGDPGRMFMNMNTTSDRDRAESIMRKDAGGVS